jgi:FlgD Ig-like domain
MRTRTAFLLLIPMLLLARVASAIPAHLWSHNYGDFDSQYAGACFADPSGNVILCGSFYGSVNIATPYTSLGRRDAIVAKWDANGNPLWSKRVGFKSVDTGWSGTTDVSGNVILVGSTGPHPNERDAFIAKYSPTGTQQWIKTFIATPDSIAYVQVAATDATKHIHVAGQFNGSINLGGTTLVAQGENDVFWAEFDASGNHIWSKAFHASAGIGELGGIGVDPLGQPVLFGDFGGSVNFGGGLLTTVGSSNLFLVKLDTDGNHLWSRRFGETGDQGSQALAIDPSGRICITGEMDGNLNFGGGVLTPVAAPDIFLAMFNSAGTHLWSKRFGGADTEQGYSVAFASNNDVLLSATGYGPGAIDFGGGPLAAPTDLYATFVARFFSSNGAHRWSTKFAGNGNIYGFVDEYNGQLIMGGEFLGTVNLGGSDLISGGSGDFFVARFSDHITAAGPTLARASLGQNTPNPFNPSTQIAYTLAAPVHAVIEIVDVSGDVVARIDEGMTSAGAHSTIWNGRDERGVPVASGVYFYRLAGMPDVAARKMVLLK